LSGDLVRKLTARNLSGSEMNWDGKNEDGEIATSGVYMYIAKDSKGTRKGKFIFIK
jgi:flagellar hook assembly protein FlgD